MRSICTTISTNTGLSHFQNLLIYGFPSLMERDIDINERETVISGYSRARRVFSIVRASWYTKKAHLCIFSTDFLKNLVLMELWMKWPKSKDAFGM